MASYYLRPACGADFNWVYTLKKIAYKAYVHQTWGWDEAFQLKFHRENFSIANCKIICAGEQPIGSVDVKEGETNVFISGLYLLPEFQSQGIGTQIIRDLLLHANARAKRVELEVLLVNERAYRLYKKLGFSTGKSDQTKMFLYKDPET